MSATATGGKVVVYRERVEAFTSGSRHTNSANFYRTRTSTPCQTQHSVATFAVSRAGPVGDDYDDSLAVHLHAHAQFLPLESDICASENLYRSRELPSDFLVARFLGQR